MDQKQLTSFLENFQVLEQKVNLVLDNGDVNAASDELQKLTKLVSECGGSLPSYELRKAQASVSNLQKKIVSVDDSAKPKGRFKFSRKVPDPTSKPNVAEAASIPLPDSQSKTTAKATISKLQGVNIVLDSDKVSSKDVWLDELDNCTVCIAGIPSTIHMTKLTDCKIIGGPVLTSIFLEHCQNCSFVLGCQQVRIHKSHSCQFYLHVRSRAIIEDCSGCRFAPYNREYDGKSEEFAAANLDLDVNNWNQIDDFNWLSAEEPSPNWSILNEHERVLNWNM